MKTRKEIIEFVKAEMQKIDSDERFHYPKATIDVNAPLALIQFGMGSKMRILQKVLRFAEDEDDG